MNKKYLTPSVSELYKAPIIEGDIVNNSEDRLKYAELSNQLGHSLLSKLNALIDVKHQFGNITQDEAIAVFNTARLTVIETVQLN